MICRQDSPLLLITAPGSGRDRRVELDRDYMVVGRESACDIRLDDPQVSRKHAALRRLGSSVYVQDLGSSGGTFVDGTAVTTARELHPGDLVAFAGVLARFEPASTAGQETVPVPVVAAPVACRERGRAAVTRTRARWLSCTGSLVLAEGFAIAALTKASLLRQHGGAVRRSAVGLTQYRFGPSLAGIPAGLLGWGLATVGFLLLVGGIGLHIAASSARSHPARFPAVRVSRWPAGRRLRPGPGRS